jgi:hypothetical protein
LGGLSQNGCSEVPDVIGDTEIGWEGASEAASTRSFSAPPMAVISEDAGTAGAECRASAAGVECTVSAEAPGLLPFSGTGKATASAGRLVSLSFSSGQVTGTTGVSRLSNELGSSAPNWLPWKIGAGPEGFGGRGGDFGVVADARSVAGCLVSAPEMLPLPPNGRSGVRGGSGTRLSCRRAAWPARSEGLPTISQITFLGRRVDSPRDGNFDGGDEIQQSERISDPMSFGRTTASNPAPCPLGGFRTGQLFDRGGCHAAFALRAVEEIHGRRVGKRPEKGQKPPSTPMLGTVTGPISS